MIEQIKKKLEALAQQKEQAIANLNALCGAEQVLRDLLTEAETNVRENSAASEETN